MEYKLKLRDVAEMLGVNYFTVWRMAKSGELRGVKVGSQWRFSERAVKNIIKRHA